MKSGRGFVELLVVLAIGILICRTYLAEPYVVPTGSMAPTLLGEHVQRKCPNCGIDVLVGFGPSRTLPEALCGNCGNRDFRGAPALEMSGDRLLVQKHLFDVRKPRRWEPAVFWNPESPDEPYVKRIVGLPGETVELRDGDVWIDGVIARKSLAQVRATRQLVYDHNHKPQDYDRYPRWVFHRLPSEQPTRWHAEESHFTHGDDPRGDTMPAQSGDVDWLEYQHWQPESLVAGPVHDFIPYDGPDASGRDRVDDLMLCADLTTNSESLAIVIAVNHRSETFEIRLIENSGVLFVSVIRNGATVQIGPIAHDNRISSNGSLQAHRLELSTFDARLVVAIDGRLMFEPYDWEPLEASTAPRPQHLALGLARGQVKLANLKIYRDIHYTSTLENGMRQAAGSKQPVTLGPGDYFVLGDNSPVSNDSRFWRRGPAVPARDFVGKPFLVHVPGTSIPVPAFGRTLFWIPDFRRIRYID